MAKGLGILAFVMVSIFYSFGQELGNLRKRELIVNTNTIAVDTLSIIPGTLTLLYPSGHQVDSSFYSVNYAKATITFSPELISEKEVYTIEYRVFPLLFERTYFHRSYQEHLSPDSLMDREPQRFALSAIPEPIFGEGIQTSGSIMRGIRFGNNQDISVNSSMNMQLTGELESGLMIEGAISDQTIPLQPDGTTSRIEEFDRIYLKVYRDNFAVQAGDIEMKSNTASPMFSVSRNIQGIAYNGLFETGNHGADNLMVASALAVPKGKFSRNAINGSEGNQGPYRLSGASGEPHIFIIAGSERVYVDGILLQRGEDQHYTIDYNLAELTFTHRMPINRNSRIIVEFEYSERSYARFIIHANVHQVKGRWQWYFSAFSEQDARNQPFDQELTENQKRLLSQIGDNLDLAFYAQADSVAFDPEKILYQQLDTLVGGVNYSIYSHSTDPDYAFNRVYFSFVGQGKGNYKPDFGHANGRVYRWVAPENGIPQGSYEPVKRLVTPQKRQMFATGILRKLGKGSSVKADYALSNTDLNTFSNLDSGDDIGHSVMLSFNQRISADSISAWNIGGNFLKTTEGFRIIDRNRDAEFERDWSINQPLDGGQEQLIGLWVDYKNSQKVYTRLLFEDFQLGDWYQGSRIGAKGWQKSKSISTVWEGMFSNVQDSLYDIRFDKAKLMVSKPIKFITIGVMGEFERSHTRSQATDSLQGQSFEWYQTRLSLSTSDSLSGQASISYVFREDYKPNEGKTLLVGRSEELMFDGKFENERLGNMGLGMGYRFFNPNDSVFTDIGKKERTLLSRLEYSNRVAKGLLSVSGSYELGSGLEPEYEYYFFEVPAGQGVYTWVDYNDNGIMELDEFEIAAFADEARFIRINIPGSNMIRVRTSAFSLRSNLIPHNLLKDKGKFADFMGRFSNQNSYIVKHKNRYDDFWSASNPFGQNEKDSLITSLSSQFRNSLAFNRANRKFGVEYIYNQSLNKALLANGFELKGILSHRALIWLGLGKNLTFRTEGEQLVNTANSQLFTYRNYAIEGNSSTSSLKYVGNRQITYEGGYKWNQSKNTLGEEKILAHTIFVQIDMVFPGKASLMAKSSFVANDFIGNIDSPAAYDMLRGLQSGRNATWDISLRRRLSKVFELELGYGGRYLNDGRIIHNGTMQARALF